MRLNKFCFSLLRWSSSRLVWKMLVASMLLLPLALAAPALQQLPFSVMREATGGPAIPPLRREAFTANHTLISLNDGSFVPSPAFGVGSVWKGQDVTDLVLSALASGYRHLGESVLALWTLFS